MAKLYTGGLFIEFVEGRGDSLVAKPTMAHVPSGFVMDKDAKWKLGKPYQMLGPLSDRDKDELYKAWLKAHPEVGPKSPKAAAFKATTESGRVKETERPFDSSAPIIAKTFPGPTNYTSTLLGVKMWFAPRATAHIKKESYPPSTDPAKPWWTSPPTWKAECHAQRIADVTYQGFTDNIRLAWREACTPAYKTPYDVYQHVAIPRLLRGIPVSPVPPPQAGWKLRKLEQDLEYWHDQSPKTHWAYPDESCQTWGLAMGHFAFAEHHWWNGFEWRMDYATLWSLYTDVGIGDDRDEGFIKCTIYAGHDGSGESYEFNWLPWPELEFHAAHHALQAHSASFIWVPAKRDYAGNLISPRTPDTAKSITVKVVKTDWAWYHYRLPYPSKKCSPANMSKWIKNWPDPAPTERYEPYF